MLFWLFRRSRACIQRVLLVLPLLPVLTLNAFAFDDFVHDRYLYVPVAGFCLLLAAALKYFRRAPRTQAAVLLGVAALWGSARCRPARTG